MRHSQVTTTAMKTKRPEPELSFPQLLDALEKRVDTIIGTPRYCGALPSVNQRRSHPESPTQLPDGHHDAQTGSNDVKNTKANHLTLV